MPSNEGTGSGFVNLQAYMDNNKGEGGRMVNDATSGLVGDANSFKDTASSTVADQTKAMQDATGGDKLPGLQKGLQTDASGNASAAKDFLGAGYAGPTADTAYAGLGAQQKDLSTKLGAVDGDTTVAALKDKSGAAPYTSGFGYLDKFLTGDATGKAAMDAVHARAGDVNAEGDAAKASLGTSEDAARKQLAANQQAVRTSAKTDLDTQAKSIAAKIAAKNAGLVSTNIGASKATAGDVLNSKNKLDLQALSDISQAKYDPNWNAAAGYNAGMAAPTGGGALPTDSTPQHPLTATQAAANTAYNAHQAAVNAQNQALTEAKAKASQVLGGAAPILTGPGDAMNNQLSGQEQKIGNVVDKYVAPKLKFRR
jgi:hypothetical protein